MKYYKRLKLYKTSNCVFNPETMYATSYGWYDLLKKINGKIVLNTYRYSTSTGKHIRDVRGMLDKLNILYETLEAPRGLQNLEVAKTYYENMIDERAAKISAPRTRQSTKNRLNEEINALNAKLIQINIWLRNNQEAVKMNLGVK